MTIWLTQEKTYDVILEEVDEESYKLLFFLFVIIISECPWIDDSGKITVNKSMSYILRIRLKKIE